MKLKVLINPFERIAGWQALALGVVVMALTVVIGQMNHVALIGSLYVCAGVTDSLSAVFFMQAVDFFVLFLMMWLAGLCFSKSKIRAIDVAGTMSVARAPLLLLTICCFLPVVPGNPVEMLRLLLFGILCLPFLIWVIVLMYNAFTVSCHLKGTRAAVSFTGALIVSHTLSMAIFFLSGGYPTLSSDNKQDSVVEITAPIERTTHHDTAEIIVEALKKSDIKTVYTYFDETMKNSLPEAELKNTWSMITMQAGKLKQADTHVEAKNLGGNHVQLLIPCTFERAKLNLCLTFNSDGKLAGLYIRK